MTSPNRFLSLAISLSICASQSAVGEVLTHQPSCEDVENLEGLRGEASFLQHGLEVQQVLHAEGAKAVPKALLQVALPISAVKQNGTLFKSNMSNITAVTQHPQQEQRKELPVLLNQLVAASLAKENAGNSIISTVVNIVVLVLLVLLIVLLCRHDGNIQEAYQEVKEDPQMLYKQFEQDVAPRARCTQACC
ncbi:MFAP1 [Symbiodinium pilosum]|uniref:MFAP1 protein n=1 Tax=Symbiodinium pilosum TaxID=2952 RepID=A0A812VFM8_SYMPI|nr:MFAP1 [Symbiodinium pilosum]